MFRVLIILGCLLTLNACGDSSTRVQGYVYQEPIYMSSILAGKLFTLDVDRGQQVKAGQTLFTLDPDPENYNLISAQKQLLQAQSTLTDLEKASRETVLAGLRHDLNQAQAAYEIAKTKADRFEELFKRKVIDAESRDEAVADAKVKEAAVESAKAHLAEASLGAREDAIKAQQAQVQNLEAQMRTAQWNLAQKTVYAPKDALVVDTFYRPGENVNASHPVVQLYDPERLFAIFFVNEPIVSEICLGQAIWVSHDREKHRVKAFISYISPEAEYTPPVIYSRDNNQTLVFRVQATLAAEELKSFHSGQPIDIYLPDTDQCHE